MVVDPVFFLGTLFLQLGIEVVRQLAFAMPVAFAWEFERDIAWWSTDRRLENGALTGSDPPTAARVDTWVQQGIHIDGRPEWVFVKVHTHGAIEKTAASLLGEGSRVMHTALSRYKQRGWKLHYVTAREMYNVARAAMDGKTGEPSAYFDYVVKPPPIAA